jgi:hypothetical protein
MLSFGRIWVSVGVVSHEPPIQWVSGTLSVGVKRPGREADHSPSCSAIVKNTWSYISTPQYVFMEWFLVKHRDNFTFTFYIFLHWVKEYVLILVLSVSFV